MTSITARKQQRLHGHKFRHRLLFFRPFLPDHGEAPSSLQLDGYQAAIERYGLDETELVSLRGCSKALFHKDERKQRKPLKT